MHIIHLRTGVIDCQQFEDKAFRVCCDTYVTEDSGTGIVHQAPAFGEDDQRVVLAHGILSAEDMPPDPINDAGLFTDEAPDLKGLYVKVYPNRLLSISR